MSKRLPLILAGVGIFAAGIGIGGMLMRTASNRDAQAAALQQEKMTQLKEDLAANRRLMEKSKAALDANVVALMDNLKAQQQQAQPPSQERSPQVGGILFEPLDPAAKAATGADDEVWTKVLAVEQQALTRRNTLIQELKAGNITTADFTRQMIAVGVQRDAGVEAVLSPEQSAALAAFRQATSTQRQQQAAARMQAMVSPPGPASETDAPARTPPDF